MTTAPISETTVRTAEEELLNAIRTSDVPYLERVLHDDLLFIAPGGMLVTKESDLASHRAKTMVVESVNSNIEEIRFINDIAIVVVVYDTKGTMMGTPIAGQFRYIRFWKNSPDGLQVIGGSVTPVTG